MGGRRVAIRSAGTPAEAPAPTAAQTAAQGPADASAGRAAAFAAAGLYVFFVAMSLLQSPGRTTYDTRAELTQRPGDFIASAFTLWHPDSNFGEIQNQAYGYLFPQGTWFVLGDLVGLSDWVSQRLWTALVLIVAVEGARRVAGALGVAPAFALLAGVAYGFAPRFLGTLPVISGETLPGAVMPWVVLPILLAMAGRTTPWKAVLLSGAAVVCMGGVNAVENAGSLPLPAILVLWGAWRHLLSWRVAAGWVAAVAVASAWWVLPLLVLADYAPPFYQYVESAADTTALVGWSEAARGDSHWVAYLIVGDQQWWPAANDLVSTTWLVLLSAVVAAVGLVGLVHLRHVVRGPLVLAVLVGLGALTIAHGGWEGSPVASQARILLDGPLQIFRNVHKIDPTVRLPLAVGFGHAVALGVRAAVARRPALADSRPLAVMAALLVVISLGQPYLANNARTPGWERISDPWQEAHDYLVDHQDGRTALVLPGSGFAQQTWGWTLDEPLVVLGGTNFVTRSQVPIVPGESIRFLAALDQLVTTGQASSALADQLARAGVGHVVVRRDLDRRTTGSPHPAGASVSMTTAGLRSVAAWGGGREGGPQVEVYEVPSADQGVVRATPLDDVLTVRGGPESILALQESGLVGADRATVLEGEPGWTPGADVVSDDDQRRERAFGSGDEALSAVLGPDDDWRLERSVHDYPTVPGASQVTARYDGLRSLTASSSQAYADNFGAVVLQEAPAFAVDGDPDTRWVTSSTTRARQQWLRLVLDEPRPVREVEVLPVADDPQVLPIRSLEVRAGDQTRTVATNPSGAPVTVTFDGSVVDVVEVRVREVGTAGDRGRVGLREVTVDGLVATRTLVVPGAIPPSGAWVFGTVAERRACVAATQRNDPDGLPDCDVARIRGNEEPEGLDRTFTTDGTGRWSLRGRVIARATPEAVRLLEPVASRRIGATSVYGSDPRVSSRFLYDGSPTTGWISADEDRTPTVLVRLLKRRTATVTGLRIEPGPDAPISAVVRSGSESREVDLTGVPGEIRFEPLRGSSFDIEFRKAPGSPRVAVREIGLLGVRLTRALDTATPTGALCGLGPNVVVDGRRVQTRVVGTMADVVQGSPMTIESCGDLDLAAGEHRLTVPPTAEFQVVSLAGVPTASDATEASGAASRDLEATRWSASNRTVEVGAGAATLLQVPENFNAGWVAEVDGEELQALRVDGWQQGWVLPAGDATTVQLTFRPQSTYQVLLPLGLGLSGALLLLGALLVLLGLRRRPPRPLGWPEADRARAPVWAWPVLTGAVTVLLGPVAAVGLVAAAVLHHRVGPVALAAAALLLASAGVDVLGGAQWWLSVGDATAAAAIGLLAGTTLRPLPSGSGEVGT